MQCFSLKCLVGYSKTFPLQMGVGGQKSKNTYAIGGMGGGCSKRTCAYNGGGEVTF